MTELKLWPPPSPWSHPHLHRAIMEVWFPGERYDPDSQHQAMWIAAHWARVIAISHPLEDDIVIERRRWARDISGSPDVTFL